jgi:hypothetical protein
MEKALQNRVGYFFVAILIITTLGFYPTYLSKFPTFEGLTNVHHFHGFIALTWILMLIAQAFLIRYKKYALHRLIGKAGYVVMPLLLISFFLVARTGYFRNSRTMPEADALAELTLGLPDILSMAILFTLAMAYRHRPAWHMRFMTGTGLMIIGPGLGRFLIVFCGVPFTVAVPLMVLLTSGVALVWMIADIRHKKSVFPMGVFVVLGVCTFLIGSNNHSDWWQSFARWVVANLF